MTGIRLLLEDVTKRLRAAGLEGPSKTLGKIASLIPAGEFGLKQRRMLSQGRIPGEVPHALPGSPMLRPGEAYEEIDPATGKTTRKRYRLKTPFEIDELLDYFGKGRDLTDFLRAELTKATSPSYRAHLKEMLDVAEKREEQSMEKMADEPHFLSSRYHFDPSLTDLSRVDRFKKLLIAAMKIAPRAEIPILSAVLERAGRSLGQIVPALAKCASALRAKGYDALAERLAGKKTDEDYEPHKGVRIRSFKEYIAESKEKPSKDVSLFDEMFDKYIEVLETAAHIVKKAKKKMHTPEDIDHATQTVIAADHLMMDKLLEIGETMKETWS